MVKIILWLLAAWLVLTLVGAVVKGLVWLAVIGGVLFLATAAYGAIKSGSGRKGIKGPR
ncbi:hypothetical protein ABZ816_12880 [Actinosynnema sp. NPDC047251]|uniref:Putative secreted protein n=1 Tax=Saccharothrix espanaensis (strain ATCC 51144 / DSM 44229 / JCM 9112 / NBRC 15066 / NRRL 15764) TaxID=1179773 RepID=K0KB70_SACES|nr:hypothetical protein [Saccharothrix espanaensis]CCH35491.1 putative secreted protein [Saccharothrix espanaensis DSM 44229]